MRALLLGLSILFLVVPVAEGAAGYDRVSGQAEVSVQGVSGMRYFLRFSHLEPEGWAARGGELTRRYGPVGSCRMRVIMTARAVRGEVESATARVGRLLPGSGRAVRDEGTRGNAAWRVRLERRTTIRALLVKPAPNLREQPEGGRAWLEVRAVGVADPRVECHAGGPRTVGDELALMLATTGLGGFQLRS